MSFRSAVIALSFAAVAASASAPASAATTYSDSVSFMAAVQDARTIDFEGLVGTPAYPSNHPFVTNSHFTFSSSGIVVDGVQFVGTVSFGSGFETYIQGSNPDSFNASAMLWGGRILLDVFLPSGATAIGFDFGSSADMDVTISVTERSGGSFNTSRAVVGKSNQFFGYVGNEIESVRIDSGQTGGLTPYVMVDNVTIAAAIPEPHEYMLLLVGLGVLAAVTRGRRGMRR